MEWLKALGGKVVGLDTAPLIYFIEKNHTYLGLVYPFFEAVERGDVQVVTSTLTLTEVLVQPYRRGDQALALEYFRILRSAPNLKLVPVSSEISARAARLRADSSRMRVPDAIQIATVELGGATAFLTNDRGLIQVPGIRTIVLEDLLTRS